MYVCMYVYKRILRNKISENMVVYMGNVDHSRLHLN